MVSPKIIDKNLYISLKIKQYQKNKNLIMFLATDIKIVKKMRAREVPRDCAYFYHNPGLYYILLKNICQLLLMFRHFTKTIERLWGQTNISL